MFVDVTCDVLHADPSGSYTNESCTRTKTLYNESSQLSCVSGFVANDDPVNTCQLNGTWSVTTTCIGENDVSVVASF